MSEHRAADAPAGATSDDPQQRLLAEVLSVVRQHLGMEVAFIGRVQGGVRRFDLVDSEVDFSPFEAGDQDPLEDTYCGRVLDGRLPPLVLDAGSDPRVTDLAVTMQLPIGTHLSVPIMAGREVYGTLCCFSREVVGGVSPRDLGTMRMFAEIVGKHVEPMVDRARGLAEDRRRVRAVLESAGPVIALQPIVELATGSVYGYEALARFPAEEGWGPREWFEAAERGGLAPDLEVAAVRNALALLPRLAPHACLTVNLSASALLARPEILGMFTPDTGARVVLEITEHERVLDSARVVEHLAAARAAGVRIAVDDAGSGFAGLEHILLLGPEVLKLDRTLVDGVATDTARQAMCEAMVGYCRRTGATVVAEGVETEADLGVLRELGVTHAQGYLLGRPVVWD